MKRYETGVAGEDENVILVSDSNTHHIILRGSRMGLDDIQEIVRLANVGAEKEERLIAQDKYTQDSIAEYDAKERTCVTCGHAIEGECHKLAGLPDCGTGNEQWIPRK